jgi:hypothetical protein
MPIRNAQYIYCKQRIQMRILVFCYLHFHAAVCFGQNIKLEIADYSRKINGKEYATFQYVRSSYSFSRATIVFITNRPIFLDLTTRIPPLFNKKQEYTDVWVLGITGFDQKNVSEVDRKIISSFFQQIIKYRNDNDLPAYSLERLENDKIFLTKKQDICKFLSCGRQQ